MNILKWGQTWNFVAGTVPYDPRNHDENDYMHTLYNGGVYSRCFIPPQSDRPGDYVLKWDGTGTMSVGGAQTTATNGRVVYSMSGGTIAVGGRIVDITVHNVGTPGVDYPHNIRFCHVDDEAALDADPYALGVKFKQTLIDGKIGCIRLLNWIGANSSNWCHWAHRQPLTHYCWNARYARKLIPYPTDLYTTNSGDDYSATISGGALVDKLQVQILCNATATTNYPTFNYNGGGALPILGGAGATIEAATRPTINRWYTLTYFADLGSWVMSNHGGLGAETTANGDIPIDFVIKICNEVGCHPWLPLNFMMMDPITDVVAELDSYFLANLDSGLIPFYEPPNELWNTIFPATRWAWFQEVARTSNWVGQWKTSTVYAVGDLVAHAYAPYKCLVEHTSGTMATDISGGKWALTTPHNAAYGRWASYLGQAICANRGLAAPDRTKFRIICSFFSQRGSFASQTDRLESPTLVAETSAAQAAKNWVTDVCHACYWSSDYAGTQQELDWANEYGTATEARRNEIWELFFEDTGSVSDQAWYNRAIAATEFANAGISYGLGSVGYEGGYHTRQREGGAVAEPLLTFRTASRLAEIQHRLVHRNYIHWTRAGSEWFPHFELSGEGDWDIFYPNIYCDPSPPQWEGMKSWNLGKRRFKATTTVLPIPPFTVESLFANGETGAYYDFSDTANCFSDNGVTPITNGGGVYRINDKSGNGNHISQATSGSRPTWNSAGYATFDGTADHLFMSSSLDSYNKAAVSIFVLAKANPAAGSALFGEGSSTDNNPVLCLLLSNSVTAANLGYSIRNDAGTQLQYSNTNQETNFWDNTKNVSGVIWGTSLVTAYPNGLAGSTVTINRSGTFTTDRFAIGCLLRAAATSFFAADLYQAVVIHRALTSAEIADLTEFFLTK